MSSRKNNRGVTLIETLVSIVVLGVALPPLIALFTEIAGATPDDTYQRVALSYAESLMEEILSKDFEDPDEASGSFGTEEATRSAFDDVDDYDGLNNSPPRHLDGSLLADYGGFTRSVAVHNVTSASPDPATPEADGSTEFKRVRVTVAWTSGRAGELTLTSLRANLLAAPVANGLIDGPASSATANNDNSNSLALSFVSATTGDLQIQSFRLSASRSVPAVEKFELATTAGNYTQIWGGEENVPTGVLATNESNPGERVVPGGDSAGVRMQFKDLISPGPITYTFVLNFTDGSSATFDISLTWTP